MLQILNNPYPAPTHGVRSLWLGLYFGIFIGAFLVFFEPFDINKLQLENKTLKIAFYGVIASAVVIFFFYLLPFLFPNFISDKNWTVKHQIIYYFIMLFFVALFNGIYTNYVNGYAYNWGNSFWMIKITMILGCIPICIYVLFDHNRKLAKHISEVSQLDLNKSKNLSASKAEIKIPLELKNEQLVIIPNMLLYIQAEGNYSRVVQLDDHSSQTELYRTTLSHLEKHLNSENIIRCHRSYLVNLDWIQEVKGNAQGFKLTLENSDKIIPVSRKYVPLVRAYLSKAIA